jgi:acetyltransferase-like isoleucine patch superfamily enzyme
MDTRRAKRRLRDAALHGIVRGFELTENDELREILFKRLRHADHDGDDATREVMRRFYGVDVGRYTYGAFKIDLSIARGTRVGSFCSLAQGVRLGGSNHPVEEVSTHPFHYMRNRGLIDHDDRALIERMNPPVVVEDDVWVGVDAIVLPGVTVGRGAVVGAGSVVTRDVDPYTIVAGAPARVLRKRFGDDQIRRLLAIDWPSWDDETLRARAHEFRDVQAFIDRYGPPPGP